jgi:hypothetical protein
MSVGTAAKANRKATVEEQREEISVKLNALLDRILEHSPPEDVELLTAVLRRLDPRNPVNKRPIPGAAVTMAAILCNLDPRHRAQAAV